MPANIRVAGTQNAAGRNRGNSVTHLANGFLARAAWELHAIVEVFDSQPDVVFVCRSGLPARRV
jgi:hypothetical protein